MKLRKYLISVRKEAKLLLRDLEGIVLIILMPLILVVVLTLLQHRTFQNISEVKIPVVVVNYDEDSLGTAFARGIQQSEIFETTVISGKCATQAVTARQDVANGKFQIGVIIPENTTRNLKNKAISLIQKQLPDALSTTLTEDIASSAIVLFFDPVTKESFRSLTRMTLEKQAALIEKQVFMTVYSKVIDAITGQQSGIQPPSASDLVFKEDVISEYTGGLFPNATQHNVPAWTLFGMFLICIPAAGSIIRERNEGCLQRLKTLPVSYLNIMLPKALVFTLVCLFIALVIFLTGIYLMPLLGLPALQTGKSLSALFLISLAAALAASGYGIAIGTIATTHVQASTFGAVSTVILAAMGGVWVPIMVMPEIMRKVSAFSPLNWGVNGYLDVFLRNASVMDILPELAKLTAFFIVGMVVSVWFKKY